MNDFKGVTECAIEDGKPLYAGECVHIVFYIDNAGRHCFDATKPMLFRDEYHHDAVMNLIISREFTIEKLYALTEDAIKQLVGYTK